MKYINRLTNVVIDCLAVILCCLGLLLNLVENGSKPDMFVIAILLFLLCVSAYNLVKSVKKMKSRDKKIRIYMKRLNLLIIGMLIFLTSCSRSPERILSQIWGLNVRGLEHHTEFCTDEWCLNGDGLIEIKMKVDVPQIDIDSLISKGAKPLPLKEPTDTSIWVEDTNSWLERISGIKGATNGVYFYELGHQEPHESEFLIYDRDSQTLYYRLMIM